MIVNRLKGEGSAVMCFVELLQRNGYTLLGPDTYDVSLDFMPTNNSMRHDIMLTVKCNATVKYEPTTSTEDSPRK